MKDKKMPSFFWGEAVTTSVYVLTCSFTRSVDGGTPYEAWHDRKPSVEHLRVLGCVAHVKSVRPFLCKLDDRSTPMVFIGYEPGSKAYKVYEPSTRRVHVSRDVIFDETASWNWEEQYGEPEGSNGEFVVEYITSPSSLIAAMEELEEEVATTSPASTPTASTPVHPMGASPPPSVELATPPSALDLKIFDAHGEGEQHRYRHVMDILGVHNAPPGLTGRLLLTTAEEPSCIAKAQRDASWSKEMEEEMASIEQNKTWALVDLPSGHKPIGLKLVFKVKRDEKGAVVKHKAHLVAKGYVQREGFDFEEVFAPVARLDSAHLLLAVAVQEKWELHHLDVKSAFLNGELEEEVYVAQPPGFVMDGSEGKVLRLHKALYGLRQAPRAWNAKLVISLAALGFTMRCTPAARTGNGSCSMCTSST